MTTLTFEAEGEKEFYAIINFFKLLIAAKLSQQDINTFYLIEGKNRLITLVNDIKNEKINLSTTIGSVFEEMQKLKHNLDGIMVSQNFHLSKGFEEYNMINDIFLDKDNKMQLDIDMNKSMFEALDEILPREINRTIFTKPNKIKNLIRRS